MYSLKNTALATVLALPSFVFAAPSVEVGFSPEGSAQQLVINVINSAHKSIRMMAYSFTSPEIMKALIDARHRGVDVQIVIDEKGNRSRSSQAAMNLVVNAGIPLRTNGHYKIQHDKVIIVDGITTETGSFNYSRSAARDNSENAVVVRDNPAMAAAYTQHWQSRWEQGQAYQPTW
ncbi:phospholipase D family protein [Lelliottia aquatilis]|uniref:phospholipase D family nuclease n=1 Tax=Lelliottia aquatilis TaxID=2080838 RepID=UPI00157685A4|nr:phospholipase D family protein [Lelliottia aquatilis]NTZ47707.1 phospholipase D family protein [Lelliottia aquatilis]